MKFLHLASILSRLDEDTADAWIDPDGDFFYNVEEEEWSETYNILDLRNLHFALVIEQGLLFQSFADMQDFDNDDDDQSGEGDYIVCLNRMWQLIVLMAYLFPTNLAVDVHHLLQKRAETVVRCPKVSARTPKPSAVVGFAVPTSLKSKEAWCSECALRIGTCVEVCILTTTRKPLLFFRHLRRRERQKTPPTWLDVQTTLGQRDATTTVNICHVEKWQILSAKRQRLLELVVQVWLLRSGHL